MNEHVPSHCFPLNGRFDEPEIRGVEKVLETYKEKMKNIHMAGPTFFSSIIDVFMDFALEGRDLKTYFVMLILTDGEIHDMYETKRLIVEASKLPCSIIIVGVGNEDFDMMVDLDSDDQILRADKNYKAKRDIVQFVKFTEAVARGNLAEEVLKEIPAQVCRYMEMIKYVPRVIEPDFNAINRTVNRQRDAMLAKAQEPDDKSQPVPVMAAAEKKIAAQEKRAPELRKRRIDRNRSAKEKNIEHL